MPLLVTFVMLPPFRMFNVNAFVLLIIFQQMKVNNLHHQPTESLKMIFDVPYLKIAIHLDSSTIIDFTVLAQKGQLDVWPETLQLHEAFICYNNLPSLYSLQSLIQLFLNYLQPPSIWLIQFWFIFEAPATTFLI